MASNLRVAVQYASSSRGVIASKSKSRYKLMAGGSTDERYLRLLITRSQRLKVSAESVIGKLPSLEYDEEIDRCRACKETVDMGDIQGIAKCKNGHHWCKPPFPSVDQR